MLEEFFYIHQKTVQDIPVYFKRYLHDAIDWDAASICIMGPRGIGKTSLLLQHYLERYNDVEQCLYISADNVEVSAVGLFKTAKEYFQYGGQALIIDEIHKYTMWQAELKSILDTFKSKRIMVSGSSSLALQTSKVDISRRLAYYPMKGLSFREYLELKEKVIVPKVAVIDVLTDHVRLAQKIATGKPVLKYFKQYLAMGYYPFFLEGEATYVSKLLTIIEKTLYEDVAIMGNVKRSSIAVLKKLLWLIATAGSFTVNIDKISRDLGISKEYVYTYFEYLQGVGLIHCLRPGGKGYVLARKPEKAFIHDPNLLNVLHHQLMSEHDQGALRETFFVNQLKDLVKISTSEKGDFLINDKYVIEIGGKGKTFKQIKDIQNAYVAADGIEIGAGNKIPLYLFGLLY